MSVASMIGVKSPVLLAIAGRRVVVVAPLVVGTTRYATTTSSIRINPHRLARPAHSDHTTTTTTTSTSTSSTVRPDKTVPAFEAQHMSATARHRSERRRRSPAFARPTRHDDDDDDAAAHSNGGIVPSVRGRARPVPTATSPVTTAATTDDVAPPWNPRTLLQVPSSSPAFERSAVSTHRRTRDQSSTKDPSIEGGSLVARRSATAQQRRARMREAHADGSSLLNPSRVSIAVSNDPRRDDALAPVAAPPNMERRRSAAARRASDDGGTNEQEEGGVLSFVRSLFGGTTAEATAKDEEHGTKRP